MSDAKIFYTYGDHKDSECVQNQLCFDNFLDARVQAAAWVRQGMALVHIREIVETIEYGAPAWQEKLVWAASSPDLDWRSA
ncbi:MAG: hypothetical protein ACRYGG_20790 [Janthinobacterium lividum]